MHHPPPVCVCAPPCWRRGHAARPPCPFFAGSVTGHGRHAASPLVVHELHWQVHQPRSRRPRSGAIGFRFWPHQAATGRERPPPASVMAKVKQRGTVPQPSASSGPRHRAAKWSTTGLKRHDRRLRRALPRLGRVNARLTQTPRWCTGLPRPRVCAPKRAARYCGAAQSTALRTLRAVARSTPQNRFCGQRAAVEACGFRSAFGKAGSHSQRSASVSQSAGALSPKDTPRFASCSLAAVDH